MSENVEDLYLKGFMAFSAKNHDAAKAYWEKVLSLDPNHAKARKGLTDLKGGGRKTHSSKEVLQEIKRLYGAKKFQESLSLCSRLLKKHPNNKDLQGLYRKIEGRVRQQQGQPSAAVEREAKSTRELSDGAEATVEEGDKGTDSAVDVAMLVKNGVSLYEIQDYESAIQCWKKALQLDPENRLAKDYIENVSSLIDEPVAEEVIAPAPVAPPSRSADPSPPKQVQSTPAGPSLGGTGPARPGKDDLILIYNEAMALYKEQRYEQALEKWNHIIRFHPSHKETRQCIEKTKVALEKQKKFLEQLEQATEELAAGRHIEAERIQTKLSIEAPNLEGLDHLRQAIEERQRQITEIRSLEIEENEDLDADTGATSASDDEITRYFTPEAKGKTTSARQVSRVVQPKKQKKSNKILLVGVPLILIMVVGGYFGYDYYKKSTQTGNQANITPIVRSVDWNSIQQKAEDFLTLGNDFRDEGVDLLASYAYSRVEVIVVPRLVELEQMNNPILAFEIQDEIQSLIEIRDQAQAEHKISKTRITPREHGSQAEELADAELKRNRWEEGSERLYAILSNDPDNDRVREKLARAQQKLAFNKLADNELDEALQLFRRTTALMAGHETSRRHMEVIQRFFHGIITTEEKDQWFFFFFE